MRYLLLSLLLVFGLSASSQVPDYVPTDGLSAWYPFNGTTDDASMNGYDGTSVGVELVEDRYAVGNAAIQCGYDESPTWVELPPSLQTSSLDFTLSFWLNPYTVTGRSEVISRDDYPQDDGDWSLYIEDGYLYFETAVGTGGDYNESRVNGGEIEPGSWAHFVVRRSSTSGQNEIFKNGTLVGSVEESNGSLSPSTAILIGRHTILSNLFFKGEFDDFGIWNRALSYEEILSLTNSEQPVFGCIDSTACNFNAEANVNDGSCYSCEIPAAHCGEGTFWDAESQSCVIANPSDSDFDGCVSMTDLLDLLSVFGTCNEIPWSCGDLLEYQGYDYETVQIGEQCWFAENLRNENYQNGDAIPADLSDSEWGATSSGAVAVFGEGISDCYAYSPNGDACDESWSLNEYGRLYNWYAVDDARGLCPSGWHVSSDAEWMTLEVFLGMSEVQVNESGWRGTDQGVQIKSNYGWSDAGNGTNFSGFSGLPGGLRASNGVYNYAGGYGYWWSSQPSGIPACNRYVSYTSDNVYRYYESNVSYGFSVRCIKDSE